MAPPLPVRTMSGLAIKKRTIFLDFPESMSTLNHAAKLKEVATRILKFGSIIALQITGKECRVTLETIEAKNTLLTTGLKLNGDDVSIRPLVDTLTHTVSVHVFDVPIWVNDGAIIDALKQFGEVSGNVDYGMSDVEGLDLKIPNGVRYIAVKKNRPIPSYVLVLGRRARVWHAGQEPTCRICNEYNHKAKDCPRKMNKTPSKDEGSKNTSRTAAEVVAGTSSLSASPSSSHDSEKDMDTSDPNTSLSPNTTSNKPHKATGTSSSTPVLPNTEAPDSAKGKDDFQTNTTDLTNDTSTASPPSPSQTDHSTSTRRNSFGRSNSASRSESRDRSPL